MTMKNHAVTWTLAAVAMAALGATVAGPAGAAEQCVTPAVAAQAERYYALNKPRAPGHGYNWFQILLAFGEREPGDWTADSRAVEPMSAADARARVSRWSGWRPFAEALECLEAQVVVVEPEPEPVVVVVPEPEDPPQPLQAEETPKPQQSPSGTREVTGGFTAYYARGQYATEGPMDNTVCGSFPNHACPAWTLSEDDHWESDVVLHYRAAYNSTRHSPSVVSQRFCILKRDYRDDNHNSPGPIRMYGFTEAVSSAPDSVCTVAVRDRAGGALNPGWRDNSTVGAGDGTVDSAVDLTFETTLRIRDNNVLQADYPVAAAGWHVFGISTYSGNLTLEGVRINNMADAIATRASLERPEMVETADRAPYRLLSHKIAWPDYPHTEFALGDGSSWNTKRRDDTTCGEVNKSRWTDRADISSGSYVQDLVRANDETLWLLDHCYATKTSIKWPIEGANDASPTIDHWELPTIQDDEVAWMSLRKMHGKWTLSLYKPVLVTDGSDWKHTSTGLVFRLNGTVSGGLVHFTVLIPASGGIVDDTDYVLDNLNWVQESAGEPVVQSTVGAACSNARQNGGGLAFRSVVATAEGIPSAKLPLAAPAVGTDLCR